MMRAPDQAAIDAAEQRVARSARDARDGLLRARAAWRAKLAHSAGLALAAGTVSLLVGFWLVRRRSKSSLASSPPSGAGAVRTVSAAGLVVAYIMRYGMQCLPIIVQLRRARQKPAAPLVPDMTKWPPPGHAGSGARH